MAKVFQIFLVFSVSALAASTPPPILVSVGVSISASGSGTGSGGTATLTGNGQVTGTSAAVMLFGAVNVKIDAQEISKNVCNISFAFTTSTAFTLVIPQMPVIPIAGRAGFAAVSSNQACSNSSGVPSGFAQILNSPLGISNVSVDAGSFNYTLDVTSKKMGQISDDTFTLNGKGLITFAFPGTAAGPGGGGYPVSGPGGPGYPISGPGGGGYSLVPCFQPNGAGNPGSPIAGEGQSPGALVPHGLFINPVTWTVATSDTSGNSPITVYDISDPSASLQIDFWDQSENQQFESQLLVINNQTVLSITQSVPGHDRPCQKCGDVPNSADAATASSAAASFKIVTPIQSSAASYVAASDCPNSPTSCWISIPTPNGKIPASSRAAITAMVNPQGLPPGVYTGSVHVAVTPSSGAGSSREAPVTLIVNTMSPALTLSETGVDFQAVSGSTVTQGQFVAVSNSGSGTLSFSAIASTVSGGDWLAISPLSGSATSSAASVVNIQANPSNLAPGQYFGSVTVTGTAINSPQSVNVVLTVLPAVNTNALISPTSLSFIALPSGNPASRSVEVITSSSQTLTVSTILTFAEGNGWFTATPSAATLTSAQPLTETIAVNTTGLAPGTYLGTMDIHLAETNSDYLVSVELVVPKSIPSSSGTSTACTPTQLLPVFTNLEGGFQALAAVPVAVQVNVTDDCGSPLTSGSIVMYFPGSEDPAVSLAPLGNGQWTGSWMPHNIAGGAAQVGIVAASFTSAIYGSAGIAGTLVPNSAAPLVNAAGVVSAASLTPNAPVAPGSYLSIFGSNLSAKPSAPSSLPLPTTLGGAQVLLGGHPLPLNFVGPKQINAIVPYDTPVNTIQQLTVTQNGMYSLAETLVVAVAQPAVFTQDQSGAGAAVITVVKPDGTQFPNTPSEPAESGDALVIYCAGLGAVNPPVADGAAAPSSPPAMTVNPVNVTIGGKPAPLLFSGLAPGFAGLYQVNVTVPLGITAAPDVPVILYVGTASSPSVTVAIR